MTPGIADHLWGLSAAQDRVWAQVCGLAPSATGARLLMVVQAYIDDSQSTNGTFVLAGYIASAERWAAFAKEWESALPFGTLNKYSKYHFKMSEMALLPERMERVPYFYKIIEANVLASLSIAINIRDLAAARNRLCLYNAAIDWGYVNNSFLFAARALFDLFHHRRSEMIEFIPIDQGIDFIFDDQSEKGAILNAWSRYLSNMPVEIREMFGATPRFENDEKFLPLQAADLWAWWVRKWTDDGLLSERLNRPQFGHWVGGTYPHWHISINLTQEQIIENLETHLRSSIGPDPVIYDVKFSWE